MGWKRISASNYFSEEDVKHSRLNSGRSFREKVVRPTGTNRTHPGLRGRGRSLQYVKVAVWRANCKKMQTRTDLLVPWREKWELDGAATTKLYVFVSCDTSWNVVWSNSWRTLLHSRSNKASLSARIPEHKEKRNHLFISFTGLRMSTKESWFFNNIVISVFRQLNNFFYYPSHSGRHF